jgi:hypothetical protein
MKEASFEIMMAEELNRTVGITLYLLSYAKPNFD